ncbi:MAG: hypothetical protein WBC33_10960 [Conexibacter sp.]
MTARLPLLVVVLALLLIVAPAQGFAGRNSDLVYGWSQLDEPELGPSWRYIEAIRLIAPGGGEPRTVAGCDQTVPAQAPEAARTCVLETFADPAVSRDRERIAFDNGASLALVDPDGSDFQQLPAHSADDGEPAFSAAGGRLAFSAGAPLSGAGQGNRGIWVRNLASGTVRQLVAQGSDPAWSSRNWIAFERTGQIWIVRPGGHGLRRLTGRGGAEPTWSPHGTQLAFVRGASLLVLDLGTQQLRRVERSLDPTDLAWSPDGRRLAYTLFDGGVWTVRTDGRQPRELVAGGVGGTYSFQAAGVDWRPLR